TALTLAGRAGRQGVSAGARGAWQPFAELGVRLRNWWRHRQQRQKVEPAPKETAPKKLSLETADADVPPPSPELRSSVPADRDEPTLQIEKPQPLKRAKSAVQRPLVPPEADWQLPDLDLLDRPAAGDSDIDEKLLRAKAQLLAAKIREYGIEGQVTAVRPGPVISVYEFKPAPGVKVSRIANLEDDLALATESLSVRIVAPIPGRDVVGIEIPNKQRESVALREIVESEGFWNNKINLPFAIGKDTGGAPVVADITKMPHLLVAGATGAGKSVGINSLIVSLLYRHSPDTLRLFLIDPKRLELSFYSDIPHLEGHEVVTDPHEAFALLDALVREMEERYEWMAHAKVRNITTYNKAVAEGRVEPRDGEAPRKMPFLVCIVDELADLMMVTRKQIEEPIARLAQMARAAGIHLVLATQRPSVDVLTGLIKANFPTRIAFKVSSKADARVVMDQQGAENLLGQGDMLFKPPTSDIPMRVHGAFVSEEEVTRVADFWKAQAEQRGAPAPAVSEDLIQESLQRVRGGDKAGGGDAGDVDDELFEKAVDIAAREGVVSTSRIQRALSIGYNRAARIMDAMEARGMVGPPTGAGKPRKFLGAGGGVDG
ncbi:MAG: DNA translocase FtsK, partial [Candidatus Dadabacteria bacterium]